MQFFSASSALCQQLGVLEIITPFRIRLSASFMEADMQI